MSITMGFLHGGGHTVTLFLASISSPWMDAAFGGLVLLPLRTSSLTLALCHKGVEKHHSRNLRLTPS